MNQEDIDLLEAADADRPIMRSVNILMTEDIAKKLKSVNKNRSAAVREVTSVVMSAYASGHEWVIGIIKDHAEATTFRNRKETGDTSKTWKKAIVWIPEKMMRDIERIGIPNKMKPAEFLRGVVIYATED